MDTTALIVQAQAWLVDYGPKIVGALLTLVIGLWVIKKIISFISKRFEKSNFDPTLAPFILNLVNSILKVLLVLSVITKLGVQTTSFVAILGAVGLAIGMALQGSLGNLAGGVLILIFRPFGVGSYIKAQGQEGEVSKILLFVTVLRTLDNRTVYLPNGALSNGSIEVLNEEENRRVDMVFGIGYGDDIDKARASFKQVLDSIPEVLSSPAPDIIVTGLGDSSVNFSVRPWCKATDYWTVYAGVHEKVKKTLDKEGISIPFPQRDVHLHQVQS